MQKICIPSLFFATLTYTLEIKSEVTDIDLTASVGLPTHNLIQAHCVGHDCCIILDICAGDEQKQEH